VTATSGCTWSVSSGGVTVQFSFSGTTITFSFLKVAFPSVTFLDYSLAASFNCSGPTVLPYSIGSAGGTAPSTATVFGVS
jgi:hypothetical protein